MVEEKTPEGEGDPAKTGGYGESRTDVDAMGNDKRRVVIGKQYGATLRKRLFVYGAVVGVIVVGAIVFLTVVSNYDNRDRALKETAPWTAEGASQEPPRDLDFLANGPKDCPDPCGGDTTIPPEDIVNR